MAARLGWNNSLPTGWGNALDLDPTHYEPTNEGLYDVNLIGGLVFQGGVNYSDEGLGTFVWTPTWIPTIPPPFGDDIPFIEYSGNGAFFRCTGGNEFPPNRWYNGELQMRCTKDGVTLDGYLRLVLTHDPDYGTGAWDFVTESVPEDILPEIIDPYPTWVMPHGSRRGSKASHWEPGSGHSRSRTVRTGRPQFQEVTKMLDPAQKAAWFNWGENDLRAWTRHFTTRIANYDGSGFLWHDAVFMDPPHWEMIQGALWGRVTATLIIYGNGNANSPIPTSAQMELGMALTGSARIPFSNFAEIEVLMALNNADSARIEVLLNLVADFELGPDREMEDGVTMRIMEDGTQRIVE